MGVGTKFNCRPVGLDLQEQKRCGVGSPQLLAAAPRWVLIQLLDFLAYILAIIFSLAPILSCIASIECHPFTLDCAVVGSWSTQEESGGEWAIDASGKTTLDGKDYGPKYHIKQDPTGVLRRGDGWVSAPDSTEDRLIWTLKGKKDVVWIRQFY